MKIYRKDITYTLNDKVDRRFSADRWILADEKPETEIIEYTLEAIKANETPHNWRKGFFSKKIYIYSERRDWYIKEDKFKSAKKIIEYNEIAEVPTMERLFKKLSAEDLCKWLKERGINSIEKA